MYQTNLLQTSRTLALTPVSINQDSTKPYPSTHRDSPLPAQRVTPIAQAMPEPKSFPKNKSRRRGVVLTEQGWQKLLQAQVVYNQFGERYTFEELSEQTLLNARTVGRILGREVGVDKRSLSIFFNAFNLQLDKGDYTAPIINNHDSGARVKTQGEEEPFSSSLLPNPEEELTNLKQRITANCYRLAVLLGFDGSSQTTLTVKLFPQTEPQLEISQWQHYNLHFSS